MASMRDIKRRKSSITSTQQITKAMKLVATVKLQKARARAEGNEPYFRYMYSTIQKMLGETESFDHPFLAGGGSEKKALVVITSNRGLAGGYNQNIVKKVLSSGIDRKDALIISIGQKGHDALAGRGYEISADYSEMIDEPCFSEAQKIASELLDKYKKGEIGEIYLYYTHFKNTVSHIPTEIKLLPVEKGDEKENTESQGLQMNYEPSVEDALEQIIPSYVTSILYGAMAESSASENGARMQAMDSATDNAGDLIDELTLRYNQARQSSITQELTEIVAGAESLA